MQEEKIRLNKYMAQAGFCSRREADKLIGQGRVYVNGTVAGWAVWWAHRIRCRSAKKRSKEQQIKC